jgi:hypothetical protein
MSEEEQKIEQQVKFVVEEEAPQRVPNPPAVAAPMDPADAELLQARFDCAIGECMVRKLHAEASVLSRALLDMHDGRVSVERARSVLEETEAKLAAMPRQAERSSNGMKSAIALFFIAVVGLSLAGAISGYYQRAMPPSDPAVLPVVAVQPAAATFAPMSSYKVGQVVHASYAGSWWPAVIVSKNADTASIHWIGWDCSWDEFVPANRLRTAPARDVEKYTLSENDRQQMAPAAGQAPNLHYAYSSRFYDQTDPVP